MKPWRLIRDGGADGHRNMALDEALLDSCREGGAGFPTLRLYSFQPSCLSLGAFQPWRTSVDLAFCREHGIEVVRRPTGGQAVLHHAEVTYAVVARLGEPPFGTGVRSSYDAISRALLAGIAALGIAARRGAGGPRPALPGAAMCFARATEHEIAAGSWKVAGSAQVRRRGAFLQHGSLPLEMNPRMLAGATGALRAGEAPPDLRGLAQVAGRRLGPEDLAGAILRGFGESLGVKLMTGRPTDAEALRAEWLRGHKYLTARWTFRR